MKSLLIPASFWLTPGRVLNRFLQDRYLRQDRATVTRTCDIDHIQVMCLDQSVQVDIEKIQSRRGSPVAEQARLNMGKSELALQERIVAEVDLPHGKGSWRLANRRPSAPEVRATAYRSWGGPFQVIDRDYFCDDGLLVGGDDANLGAGFGG